MEKNVHTLIGDRIRMIRVGLRLSQAEMAEQLGIAKQSILRYENNHRVPKQPMVSKIAETFNVDKEWLTSGKTTNNGRNFTVIQSKHEKGLTAFDILDDSDPEAANIRGATLEILRYIKHTRNNKADDVLELSLHLSALKDQNPIFYNFLFPDSTSDEAFPKALEKGLSRLGLLTVLELDLLLAGFNIIPQDMIDSTEDSKGSISKRKNKLLSFLKNPEEEKE